MHRSSRKFQTNSFIGNRQTTFIENKRKNYTKWHKSSGYILHSSTKYIDRNSRKLQTNYFIASSQNTYVEIL